MLALLSLLVASPSTALVVPSRKQFLIGATLGTCSAAQAAALYPATQLVDELLDVKKQVHDSKSSAKKVSEAKARTLEPLRNAMEKNPLNDEKAKLQPLLMKGHMLELDQALAASDGFSEYVSKTTGETYPGGKVERELEEAVETAQEYCILVDCDTLLIYR